MAGDREFALDVLDFCVQHVASESYSEQLGNVLTIGGSEWDVSTSGDQGAHVVRRIPGPIDDSIDAIRTDSERAHHHLEVAWSKLVGRNPDPSTAYRESVRAVESAAKPTVTPNDSTATLGKIIRAIRDKPEKWHVMLDQASSSQIAEMAELLWRGQLDRHGTDDLDAPLNVSQNEADAAFYIALALVRLFTSGAIVALDAR